MSDSKTSSQRFVVLLGAGASVEAGLLTSAKLTESIYNSFSESREKRFSLILAYIISKLQARNAKRGLSPYTPIEVEELFDALNLIIKRDGLLIAEFVERWDATIDGLNKSFDGHRIRSHFNSIFNRSMAKASRSSSFDASPGEFEKFAEALQPVSSFRHDPRRVPDPLTPFFSALVRHLVVDESRIDYLTPLVIDPNVSIIATLNYDLSIETACKAVHRPYDYGLDRWNQQKRVDWRNQNDCKILKLHGSLNWTGDLEDPQVRNDEIKSYEKRAMIFGGTDNKLSADGPFLQFLYKLERSLLTTNSLLVVGYSFRDAHINALLQRWRLTRRNSRLAVVDPVPPPIQQIGFYDGPLRRQVGQREVVHNASVRLLRCTASEGIRRFIDEPDLFDRPVEEAERSTRAVVW